MAKPITPLAKYRGTASLSLEEFGAMFGVNKSTMMRWEKGTVPVPVNRLADIEAATGIPRADLRPDIFGGVAA